MKKIIITTAAILATVALILGNKLSAEDKRNSESIYPACAVVVRLDYTTDTVTVEDVTGHTWQFFGVEDWCPGDVAALLMYDNGTQSIRDDEIITAHYAGTVDMFDDIAFTITD